MDTMLSFVSTVTISATSAIFVVKDRFVINTKRNAPVKISYLSENFREWFLEKIEESMAETTLRYTKPLTCSVDDPILAEPGNVQETALAQVYALMERQLGESGTLLKNGYANIFYIRDVNGVLRAVSVHSYADGWSVDAYSLDDSHGWYVRRQVFSCNSLCSVPVTI